MWRARFARIVMLVLLALGWSSAARAQDLLDPAASNALSSQTAQLYRQGQDKEATQIAEKALALAERTLGLEHPDTIRSLNNLAAVYEAQGRYGEAEPLLKRALARQERTLGLEHPDTLANVNNLGLLHNKQGRYDEAEPLHKRALAGQERTLGPEHPWTLTSVNNLGLLYNKQGRYNEAETLHKRALADYERALGPEHQDTLRSVNNLAAVYQAQGRYGEAELLYKRALASRERALGPEHQDTLLSVRILAALYQTQGRQSEAEPLLKRVLARQERTLGPEHPDTLKSVNNLATLYFRQRDWSRAAALLLRSSTAIAARTQRGALATGQAPTGKKKSEAEQSRSHFMALVKATYRLAPKGGRADVVSSQEMFQAAQWALSSEAAQSLAQMAARGAKGDPALAVLVRERQDLMTEWQQHELLQNAALGQETVKRDVEVEAENSARMAAIDKRIAEIDKRLAADFPDYAALAGPAPLSVEEAHRQLGADEALVLFLDTLDMEPAPEETFIWVVTRTDMRWVRADLGSAALIREVQALRCGLDHTAWEGPRCKGLTGADYTQADYLADKPLPFDHGRSHRLYKALFGEVEDLIKGKHLLIVPSGALTQLPFQVLVTAPSDGCHRTAAWLVRSHALSVLPAVSSLKALRHTGRPSVATQPLIGFGNPLLDGFEAGHAKFAKEAREKQSCPQSLWQRGVAFLGLRRGVIAPDMPSGLANISFIRQTIPLPDTADELCEVARDIGADVSAMRLGARATEREVKAMSARGELAQYRVVHFATHAAMAGQMTGSVEPGLILTPPDTASEDDDGYLSASEIAALRLDADWVILSACNTAAGDAESAEALSGLARAFIYAQTRALLVSHWEVYSRTTATLITTAMREMAGDKTVGRAEALRRAILALIDKGEPHQAHPAYWAPFIVVGEGAR